MWTCVECCIEDGLSDDTLIRVGIRDPCPSSLNTVAAIFHGYHAVKLSGRFDLTQRPFNFRVSCELFVQAFDAAARAVGVECSTVASVLYSEDFQSPTIATDALAAVYPLGRDDHSAVISPR